MSERVIKRARQRERETNTETDKEKERASDRQTDQSRKKRGTKKIESCKDNAGIKIQHIYIIQWKRNQTTTNGNDPFSDMRAGVG